VRLTQTGYFGESAAYLDTTQPAKTTLFAGRPKKRFA